MNIFTSCQRSRFFIYVNITGLAIGLAASIMLIMFVVNELSYDRHFADADRIVRLLTVYSKNGKLNYSPICLRKAYSELPNSVPEVEAAVQIYNAYDVEVTCEQKRFQKVKSLLTDPEFFKIFKMKFIEGTPETALAAPNSAVFTRRQAEIMFGSTEKAINQTVSLLGSDFTVSGIVEELPKNTHFGFDMLAPTKAIPWLNEVGGLEFHSYYLIRKESPVETARANIEKAYLPIVALWGERIGDKEASGVTEMLSDAYLNSKASFSLGATSSMNYIRILTILAMFILLLAVSNFISLFVAQGEMRMKEIGIRKANGARIGDIVRLFFTEISTIVGIAFIIGFVAAILCVPYFGELINRNIDLMQLFTPSFIIAAVALFVVTAGLSAFYPAIYLSRFSPLEILCKRIRFSRRRLTASVVVFQSVVSIVLLSIIYMLYSQTSYLEKLPAGYNTENVMSFWFNNIGDNYHAVRQELLNLPEVKAVSGSHHIFGYGYSGQSIAPWDDEEKVMTVNEYRLMTGMPELMELELLEGRFWRDDDPDSTGMIIINATAAKILSGDNPPLETCYHYPNHRGPVKVIGIVKDFYYDNPALTVAPIVLSRIRWANCINIRFIENANLIRAQEITTDVMRRFDPGFILDPQWSRDIYNSKFREIKTVTRLVGIGSAFSIFITMLGLLAIHLFSTVRRTKEIGVRRVYGASRPSVFVLLSIDVLTRIGIAAVIAVPASIWFLSEQLGNYSNHAPINWKVFVFPVVAQCLIALATTSSVSVKVLSQNPVKSLKTE